MSEIETNDSSKKKQVKYLIWASCGLFALVMLGLLYSDNKAKEDLANNSHLSKKIEKEREKEQEILKQYKFNPSKVVKPEDQWMDVSEREMGALKEENNKLEDRIKKLESLMESANGNLYSGNSVEGTKVEPKSDSAANKNSSDIKSPVKLSTPLSVDSVRQSVAETVSAPSSGKSKKNTEIGYVDLSPVGGKGKSNEPKKNTETYIPAGSFAKVLVLSGVDAPTGGMAETNPLPIVLRILDSAILPNFFDADINDCHVVGAATGEIAAERVMIRTELMTCVLANDDIIEVPIRGYIAGEDGKAGFRGKVISKQGAAIAKSLFAGIASGMGNSISSQYQQVQSSALGTVTTVDPNKVAESGIATGAANTLEKIADFYFKRANELYPIIELAPNRIGELVIIKGSQLENALVKDEEK